jgi:hypothetical protein
MGSEAVGPPSYDNPVDVTTDPGKGLAAVLKEFNAIGAAVDALQAAGAGETPARSERISELWAMWETREVAVKSAAQSYVGDASFSATHISTGEISPATVTSREEDGLTFTGQTEY